MNKLLFQIALLCFPFFLAGQNQPDVQKKWKELRDSHGFRKNKDYKGPEAYGDVYPSTISESEPIGTQQGSASTMPYRGKPYSAGQVKQGRYIPNTPTGGGTVKKDPKIVVPDPVTVPEIDGPELDGPDVDTPDISGKFWEYLLIILLLVIIALVIFYALRNRAPSNKSLPMDEIDEDTNPAAIPKTELEIRLEEAEARGDYRECVRIYFLFAMKELIAKRWIFWKREKTNMHYILEMQGRPTAFEFEKVVGIYELVWYGDYIIDRAAYRSMEPVLAGYYKQLESIR